MWQSLLNQQASTVNNSAPLFDETAYKDWLVTAVASYALTIVSIIYSLINIAL